LRVAACMVVCVRGYGLLFARDSAVHVIYLHVLRFIAG
jgi:hypothetical protein